MAAGGSGRKPSTEPWSIKDGRLVLAVRLTPRASRDAIEGWGTGPNGVHLMARVRAVPESGAANAALEALIAKALGVPKSRVTVIAGTTSRLKQVGVEGDATTLLARCPQVLGA